MDTASLPLFKGRKKKNLPTSTFEHFLPSWFNPNKNGSVNFCPFLLGFVSSYLQSVC